MNDPSTKPSSPSVQAEGDDNSIDDNSIEVRFGSDLRIIDDELTFGRNAALIVDEKNKFLHRVVGSFTPDAGGWCLSNRGSTVQIRLFAIDGVHVIIPPGGRTMLGAHTGTVSFAAGPSNYELTYRLVHAPDRAETLPVTAGDETAEFGVPLTKREIDFMIAFARPILTGSGMPTPTYVEVASMFGVKKKTVDATLQRLRRKLIDSGITHLASTESLVTHLLATGRITYTHLLEQSINEPLIDHVPPGHERR